MLARRNKKLLFLAIAGVIVVALFVGISNWLDSSRFGKVKVTAGNGTPIYLIHESWGLHSDQISITRNPDGCVPPDPVNDYIDTYGDGHTVIYSATADGIVLYTDSGPTELHQPKVPWEGVKVTVKRSSAWGEMLRNPSAHGVMVVKVPLNEVCWKNFFRRVGTSLRNAP